jgi:RNA polymerase sigma factor (sigma-70 family)
MITEQELSDLWDDDYPKVYGYFFKRVTNREDVEDLSNITLTVFFEKLLQERIEHRHGFLWTVARNQLCGFIRNKSKIPLNPDIQFDEVEITAAETIQSSSLISRQHALIECVEKHAKKMDYEIICRIIQDDAKAVDVAKEFAVSPEVVRQRYRRVIKQLRKKCTQLWTH